MLVEARTDRSRSVSSRDVGGQTAAEANSAPGRFAEQAATFRQDAVIARGVERALGKTADILQIGAAAAFLVPGGGGPAVVLGVGAGAAALAAKEAGEQADVSEKKAQAAEKAEAEAKAKAEKAKRDAAAKRASRGRGGDAFAGLRGDTYGGRASAHDPARADSISRTC